MVAKSEFMLSGCAQCCVLIFIFMVSTVIHSVSSEAIENKGLRRLFVLV
jgi:hypothetical protein